MPQKNDVNARNRPAGPRGTSQCQTCLATSGLSRLATAHALGGLKIAPPSPEMSQRLLLASSHAYTLSGMNSARRTRYSSTSRTASDPATTSPCSSTRAAPYEAKRCASHALPSGVAASGAPNERPAACSPAAARRKASQSQPSTLAGSRAPPAGNSSVRSIPPCSRNRSRRATVGYERVPVGEGLPRHAPSRKAENREISAIGPWVARMSSTTSSSATSRCLKSGTIANACE